MLRHTFSFISLLCVAAGCSEVSPARQAMHTGDRSAAQSSAVPLVAVRGDSMLPMDTMIARFQARLPEVAGLTADAPGSIEELIGRFGAAVSGGRVEDLRALTMSAAEFAYVYFPTSAYSRAPYAQPPEVNWLLLEQNSLKGQNRLMRAFGGRPLRVEGYRCTAEPRVEGENRIHEECLVRVAAAGDAAEIRLFGSLIERDGRFKLMSLTNRL